MFSPQKVQKSTQKGRRSLFYQTQIGNVILVHKLLRSFCAFCGENITRKKHYFRNSTTQAVCAGTFRIFKSEITAPLTTSTPEEKPPVRSA